MNMEATNEQLFTAAEKLGAEYRSAHINEFDGLMYCRFRVKGRRVTFWGITRNHLLNKMTDSDFATAIVASVFDGMTEGT